MSRARSGCWYDPAGQSVWAGLDAQAEAQPARASPHSLARIGELSAGQERGPTEAYMTTESNGIEMNPSELLKAYEELREEHRTKGGLSYGERRACLKALLKTVRARKEELAAAVSEDFGNRSVDETYAAEVYLVVAAIKHSLAEMRDWMAPQDRAVGWPWLPATAKLVMPVT